MSEIALEIVGVEHKGWLSVDVVKSIESLCGSFDLSLSLKWRGGIDPMNILPGAAAKISIDGVKVIDGFIDVIEIKVGAEKHDIRISGRDKAGDLVDCAIGNGTGEWKNLKLETLVEKLVQPFGIKVIAEVDTGAAIKKFNNEQGMTVFEAVQKLCALRGCLAVSDSDGNLVITTAGEQRASTDIKEGENLREAEAKYDFTERFSDYVVKGQQKSDDDVDAKTASESKARVKDSNIKRYRPMLIVADGQADKAKTESRARWEAAVRRGRSRSYEVTVRGWQDSSGKLWTVNQLTTLKAQSLGVNAELLIASVNYTLDDGGERTRLRLVPRETYIPAEGELIPASDTWEDDLKGIGSLGDNGK